MGAPRHFQRRVGFVVGIAGTALSLCCNASDPAVDHGADASTQGDATAGGTDEGSTAQSSEPTTGGAGSQGPGGASTGVDTTAGNSAGETGTDAGPDDTGSDDTGSDDTGSDDTGSATDCPHAVLGGRMPITYQGDTSGLPNLVTSPRLEWTDAPDDSLLFTAPSAGNYAIFLDSDVFLGASAEVYPFGPHGSGDSDDPVYHTVASCPAPSAVSEIDGVYNHNNPDYPMALDAGETVVIWISAAYFVEPNSGPYTLTIEQVG